MKEEIIACIADEHIKFLHSGQISKYIFPLERRKAHQQGVSHLIIRFFIIAKSKDSDKLFLVQKRSQSKESFPGYYTDSASGHVKYRPNLSLKDIKYDALRELEEEFGINPKNVKSIRLYSLSPEKNNKTTEIAYIFLGTVDSNIKLSPNEEELDCTKSRFYTEKELVSILNDEDTVDYSKEIWKKLITTNTFENFNRTTSPIKLNKILTDTAFFIGRFQPLHHGHIYIINYILKRHNKLKIGIGSSQLSHKENDPFTGLERVTFIKKAMEARKVNSNRYTIYQIPDIFNAQKWVDHVISIVGNVDIVYSNSDWVRELFDNKGFRVANKLGIFMKKYNSTNIRNLIRKGDNTWTQLVPKEISTLIRENDGTKRIISLYKEE